MYSIFQYHNGNTIPKWVTLIRLQYTPRDTLSVRFSISALYSFCWTFFYLFYLFVITIDAVILSLRRPLDERDLLEWCQISIFLIENFLFSIFFQNSRHILNNHDFITSHVILLTINVFFKKMSLHKKLVLNGAKPFCRNVILSAQNELFSLKSL